MENNLLIQQLIKFISRCPTCYHTVETAAGQLTAAGFAELREEDRWATAPAGRYFVRRGGSSLIAFRTPTEMPSGFRVCAVHGDSPCFKIKENGTLVSDRYLRLNTEKYGGMLCATWLDRPLSVAGRVTVRQEGRIVSRLVDFDRDLALIPSLAIHINRTANEGASYDPKTDMVPLLGSGTCRFLALLAEHLQVEEVDILGTDLYLYNRMPGTVWGAAREYVSAPRLDDLQSAFACLEGFLAADGSDALSVYALFDSEEVGSGTPQGAGSTFLADVLSRTVKAMGGTDEDYYRCVAGGFLVSADNAHACHPNHPQMTDSGNCPYLNEGIVIKFSAAQRYISDGAGSAVFREICRQAGVKYQFFANRSDLPGGSTLGHISTGQVSLRGVDIGLPQLAMHSSYETAGTSDTADLIRAIRQYYNCPLRLLPGGGFEV